jgi:hypothetical protein
LLCANCLENRDCEHIGEHFTPISEKESERRRVSSLHLGHLFILICHNGHAMVEGNGYLIQLSSTKLMDDFILVKGADEVMGGEDGYWV